MYWESLIIITLIVLIIGYFATLGKFNIRKWIFIIVLFSLFTMTGVYGSQFASEEIYGPAWHEGKQLVEGVTLLGFGILGLGLLVVFHTKKTLELGMSFGISGCVLTLTGLILALEKRPVGAKFVAAIAGVAIISFLMYKYKKQIIGE